MKLLTTAFLAWLVLPAMHAAGQTFSLDRETYAPGDTIEVTFTGTPGNGTDWIGIYPEGIIPSGNPSSTLWWYTNNTKTAGEGIVDGTVYFENIQLSPGSWRAFFLLEDGYELLTEGVPFLVVVPPSLSVEEDELRPGELLRVIVAGRPSEPADRIAVFRAGDNPQTAEPALWAYLDGSQQLPPTGSAGATLEFDTWTLTEGEWAVHFQSAAKEDIVPPVTVTIRRLAVIESFSVFPEFLEEPGTVTLEWIIDDGGVPPGKIEIHYGGVTVDVTGNAQPMQDVPLTSSTNFRLVVDGAESAMTTVYMVTQPTDSFRTDKTEYAPDEPITISWSGAAGGSTDWVGIYALGDQPGPVPSRQWVYTRDAEIGDGTEGSFTFNIPGTPNLNGPTVPLPEGDYFAALMLDDAYGIEFGVIPFRVTSESTRPHGPLALTVSAAAPAGLSLEWNSEAGWTYTIESSTNLQQWSPLEGATGLPGLNGRMSHAVSRPADFSMFYRVRPVGR